MLRKLATFGIVLAVGLTGAAGAVAGNKGGKPSTPPKPPKQVTLSGPKCVKAGVKFLIKNDLILAAARGEIDYDAIDSDEPPYTSGLINTDLPPGSFLPLGTVVELHLTKPELFDWCIKKKGRDD